MAARPRRRREGRGALALALLAATLVGPGARGLHHEVTHDLGHGASVTHEPIEVLPRLYISGALPAANASVIARLSIKAVVNAAVVDGAPSPFRGGALEYLELQLIDADCPLPTCQLTPEQLSEVSAFISRGLAAAPGAGVLVHCLRGQSRSASLVLAYLVHALKYTLVDAIRTLSSAHPSARPNHGLMRALIALEERTHGGATLDRADFPPPILLG